MAISGQVRFEQFANSENLHEARTQSTTTLPQHSETTMNMNDVLAALEATSSPDLDMLTSTEAVHERVLDEQASSKTEVDDKKRHRIRKWIRTGLERVLQRFRQRPQRRRREGGLRTRLRLFFRLRPRPQTGLYGYPQAGAELRAPVRGPYPTDGSGDIQVPSYACYTASHDEFAAPAKPESPPATAHTAALIGSHRDRNIDDEAESRSRLLQILKEAKTERHAPPPSQTPSNRVVGASAKHHEESKQVSTRTFTHADYRVGSRSPGYSDTVEYVGGYSYRSYSSEAAPARNATSGFSSDLHAAPAPSQDELRSKEEVPATKRQGAWSPSECARYDEGLTLFPNGPWKAIADHVGTRSERQARSRSQSIRAKRKRHEDRKERCKKSYGPYPSSPYLSRNMHSANASDTVSAQSETEKPVAQANEEQQTSTIPEGQPGVSVQRKTARIDKLTSVQGPRQVFPTAVNSPIEDTTTELKDGDRDQDGESLRLHVLEDQSNSELHIEACLETDECSLSPLLELFRDSYEGNEDGLFLLEPLTEIKVIK